MAKDPTGLSQPNVTTLQSDLEHRFQFHPADSQNTKDAHEEVRDVCLTAAKSIVALTGNMSREQSLAVTKLEEAMFWANAAIARGDGPKS